MIKNWTVKTKQIFDHGTKFKHKKNINKKTGKTTYTKISGSGRKVKNGFLNHVNYLKDTNRASHEHSVITILENGAATILKSIDDRRVFRKENGLKGGGVSNYATSMIFSLPTDIKQPTPEEWHKIGLHAVKQIAKVNNINFQELRDNCHIVLHDESNGLNKTSHIHVLIGNVINNEVVKGISQFKSTHIAKKSFNYSVNALLNVSNEHYQPKNKNVRDKPLFAVRADRAERIMLLFKNFKDDFNQWFNEIINKKDNFILSKLAIKVANSFDKFDNSIENKSSNLPEKVLNVIEEVENLKVDNETVQLLELPAFEEHIEPINEEEKISPKTTRKRRRRTLKS